MSETWADRLQRTHAAVAEAERIRAETIRAALDAGASTRAISEVIGVPHSTVWRWAGKAGKPTGATVLGEWAP